MSSNRYEATIDFSSRNNSHTLLVELVGGGGRVLDVGAATGDVAEALSQRGCAVTGVELDSEAAKKAERHCERVVVGDVESLDLREELGEETFDVIVFGDVLEHLKDPLQVLRRVRPFLTSEGCVVASIPNVAHGSVRLSLMQGKFRYRPLGLLDETHLRFFTRESVEELFDGAGYVIAGMERTRRGIFETEVEVDREQISQEVLDNIREDPEAETYQFVFAAYPAQSTGVVAKLSEKLGEREKELVELRRRLSRLEPAQEQKQLRLQRLTRELNALKSLRKSPAGGGEDERQEEAEAAYDRLALYGFARRYVEGRDTLCISSVDVGFGAHRLAGSAASLVALSDSEEVLERVRETCPNSDASFERAPLPMIPYSSGRVGVVVVSGMLERLEHPVELIREVSRVLAEDGVLILSTPDRQKYSNERNHRDPSHKGEMYVPELKEVLERHFGEVSIYRQGAVAGGIVFGASGTAALSLDGGPPDTRFVLAVCGAQEEGEDGRAHLIPGLDREVFDENEAQREDIELLKAEIAQMQQTEVQAFRDALKRRDASVSQLRERVKQLEAQSNRSSAEAERLRERLRDIEGSRSWRALGAYRRLRFGLDELRKKR
jgi:2-polyprenyl-3-methyl-5-hydroxy-6-metoxy-1,4-benzoquinol methylase